MKTKFRMICVAAVLISCIFASCASKKGELQEITDEDFAPKLILIASGNQRLIKFEIDKNELLPEVDSKNIKAAEIKIDIFSGRKPAEGAKESAPVTTLTFDLLKDADKLINGYDLMANAKDLKTTSEDLNNAFLKFLEEIRLQWGKNEQKVNYLKKIIAMIIVLIII